MNSKTFHILLILSFALALLNGCSEELPLDLIYTDDTDWTPSISLFKNNYQRVQIDIEGPPRKELLRNILYYKVEAKEKSSQEFSTIDSLPGTFNIPSYLRNNIYFYYQSKPVFNFRTEYSLRFVLFYRGGKVVRSNEIQFVTPIERGKVLRVLAPPRQTYPSFYYNGQYCTFSKGKLIVLSGHQLFQVDTSNSQATLLKNDLYPQGNWEGLTSCGDTLFIFKTNDFSTPSRKYTIVRVDLKSLVVDTLVTIDGSGKILQKVLGVGSALYLFWDLPNVRQQFSILDSRTGQTFLTLPDAPRFSGGFASSYSVSYDGRDFWIATTEPFDNKIVQIDPYLLITLKEYHNPVFSPDGLIWDGKNFWTIDRDTYTIVKLQLEGK